MKIYIAFANALAIITHSNSEWIAQMRLIDHQPQCLARDPSHRELVYCGTFDQGLWASHDAGESWNPVGETTIHEKVLSVAVSPTEQENGYGVVYAGTEPTALFRSADRGKTWRDLAVLRKLPSAPTWSFPPRPSTSHVRWITPDPLVAGRLFVAIEAGALVRSSDGGLTWEDRRPGSPYDTHTLVIHQLMPTTLYSAAGDGFFTSTDGGDTWTRPEEGLQYRYLWSIAIDAGNPSLLVVSAARSARQAHDSERAEAFLYRRLETGRWERLSAGLPEPAGLLTPVLAADVAAPGVFFAASNKGIFRSADAGASWESLPIRWPEGMQLGRANALLVVHD